MDINIDWDEKYALLLKLVCFANNLRKIWFLLARILKYIFASEFPFFLCESLWNEIELSKMSFGIFGWYSWLSSNKKKFCVESSLCWLKGRRRHRKIGLFGYAVTDSLETNLLRNVGQDAPVQQLQLHTKFYITEFKFSKDNARRFQSIDFQLCGFVLLFTTEFFQIWVRLFYFEVFLNDDLLQE